MSEQGDPVYEDAPDRFEIDVRTDGNTVNTLIQGEFVTVVVAWDSKITTAGDVERALRRVERVLDNQTEAVARTRNGAVADGGLRTHE